jgi:hypothetical protein
MSFDSSIVVDFVQGRGERQPRGCKKKNTVNLGKSLLYEVQKYVHPKFATPMLYAKNYSKFHNFFCRAIKPLKLYFVNFRTS